VKLSRSRQKASQYVHFVDQFEFLPDRDAREWNDDLPGPPQTSPHSVPGGPSTRRTVKGWLRQRADIVALVAYVNVA
jgi:hypothetical protein